MRRTGAMVALASVLLGASCKADSKPPPGVAPPPIGSVRVGVWMPPDPSANTYGGAAVRALVLPHLFRAQPDGKWAADLVEPGSDVTRPGSRTARFRLRENARWSDGTAITVGDLRRTIDARFVTAIDDPTLSGTIVVHFSQALPGWRRLWSGLDAVTAPAPEVWGGPYVVDTVTPNLETVLRANPNYYGDPPRIRLVHVVLVPDPEVAARLMTEGKLDVLAPPAFSARTARLARIKDARVLRGATRGGWTMALVANPARLSDAQRRSLFAAVDGRRFARVLLAGEATATGPPRVAAPGSPPTTAGVPALSAPVESPPASLLLRAVQRAAHDRGITFDLRQGDFDQILGAYATGEFDLVLRLQPPSPEPCWVCEDGSVDPMLAAAADAGKPGARAALLAELADKSIVLPLWRERPVVAVRDGLEGVSPNGFAVAGPAWNLEGWRWSR